MSAHLQDDLAFRPRQAPATLVAAVERKGVLLIQQAGKPRRRRSARMLIVDVSLAGFCVGQLLWCAHVVGLIP